MRGQGAIAIGDSGIAFGAEVPHRGRIFNEESETAGVQQRQDASGVGADGIAHSGVQTVVHVRQHHIQVGLIAAGDIQFGQPLLLHAGDQAGAKIQERAARGGVCAGGVNLQRVEARLLPELRAHVGVHGREAARVIDALQRLEVEFG